MLPGFLSFDSIPGARLDAVGVVAELYFHFNAVTM